MTDQWGLQINEDGWVDYWQLDPTKTVTGQPPVNAQNDCAMAQIASLSSWLAGMRRYPEEVNAEGWGAGHQGPTDIPQIRNYLQGWAKTPTSEYHMPNPTALAGVMYNALYSGRPTIYLRSLDGGRTGHWVTALGMWGHSGSPDPFDTIRRSDSWFGYRIGGPPAWVAGQNYADWANTLMPYYADQTYVGIVINRTRSVVLDSRMGPQ